jgi:hypothetical protein
MPGVCGIEHQWVIDGKCRKVETICEWENGKCANVKMCKWENVKIGNAAQCYGVQVCDATEAQYAFHCRQPKRLKPDYYIAMSWQ